MSELQWDTAFTRLVGCRLPVQQAGMGGVSTPELARAVAAAGGVGMLATPMVAAEQLGALVESTVEEAGGPIGVNFLMPFLDLAAVDAAAPRARLLEFFYGDPDQGLVGRVHDAGALCGWQVGSADEARAAAGAGVDFVVAQGVEAGGHVRGTVGLLPLLELVLEAVELPVVAAGGIAGGRAMAAVMAAGASAARIGTAFLATHESGAHPTYVDALVAARAEDTVLTETFSAIWPHAPHRVLRSCVDAAAAAGEVVAQIELDSGQTMPVPRLAPPVPNKQTTGDIGAMALYAGQSVGHVGRVKPAAELVSEICTQAMKLLAAR
ncbi:MAG TPA: nitronate monooxygenase [Acidimicrobiales bacterium]|nr:nitronate monooxygenase [Acidimicrobiales bacterium]